MPPEISLGNLWPSFSSPTILRVSITRFSISASEVRVFSRSGRATLSKTLIQPSKAPPWKRYPKRLLAFASSAPSAALTSMSSTNTLPWFGVKRRTICFRVTLLPLPEEPMIVKISPFSILSVTSSRIFCPPNILVTCSNLIIVYPIACRTSVSPYTRQPAQPRKRPPQPAASHVRHPQRPASSVTLPDRRCL